ncbi:MAG: response regulator [Candidatus Melainabacteria bacterium]|nr:response regulator [Candidatus Melainabacteria bacterium]
MNQEIASKNLFFSSRPANKDLLTQKLQDIIGNKKTSVSEFRVLLVDDDDDDLLIIEEVLEEVFQDKSKLQIKEAHTYDEAINKLEQEEFDICFVDYLLGSETGLELLKRAKKEKLNTPIVFLTGQGDEHVAVNAIKHGAEEYLIKSELDAALMRETIYNVTHIELQADKKVFMGKESFRFFLNLDSHIKANHD